MSWGASEFAGETTYDSYFVKPGVVFVASAGDSPGTEYPSVSVNVVSAGGTSTGRNPVTGNFIQENAWQVTGGGISAYEPRPSYQNAIGSLVGTHRGVPDIAFDADPSTGVWVLNYGRWYIVGGTSVSAPALAGIINASGKFNTSSNAELAQLYSGIGSVNFHDVAAGNCGPYAGYQSTGGWDFCTGVGTPLGYGGKYAYIFSGGSIIANRFSISISRNVWGEKRINSSSPEIRFIAARSPAPKLCILVRVP